jgi:hypothetical protein
MKNLTKQEMRAKIQRASELIFEVEKELILDSDLRRNGLLARIKITEFYNQVYQTMEDDIPYRNKENFKEKAGN